MKRKIRILSLALALCLTLGSLPAYAGETAAVLPSRHDAGYYNGKKVGVLSGSIHDKYAEKHLPDSEQCFYSSVSDMALALKSGSIDSFTMDIETVGNLMKENSSLTYVEEPLDYMPSAIAFTKTGDGEKLRDEMNEFLEKLKDDGTYEELNKKWMDVAGDDYALDMSGLQGKERTLVFATSCSGRPMTYVYEGNVTGYEPELVVMFCREYGYGLDIRITDFGGMIPGLATGVYDLAADGIAITPEREENVFFTTPDYEFPVVLCVRSEGEEKSGRQAFIEGFEKTFIREDRWKMILRGIWITLLISVCATVLGTVLGFGLCLLRMRENKFLRGFTTVYIRILQGTPILVFLMILYYLVFAKSGLSGVPVAVIAFGLNFAAYCCEIMRSGIESIDKGQREAALALGYTKRQSFMRIVMPQAAARFLPVYRGEFISMVKMTSVVGYIAVQDLTKVGDIIRSRTYDAFFPLIATALIYFLLSWLLTLLIRGIEVRIEPKRQSRKFKEVKIS